MNSIVRSMLPCLLGILVSSAFAQEVVEAKGSRSEIHQIAVRADQAWESQDWEAAAEAYADLVAARPGDGVAWHHLGYALHAEGRLDEALAAHLKAASFPATAALGAYNAACVHALKGRNDEAFRWLATAREKGFVDRLQVKSDTDLVGLREDPRFAKLLESMPEADANARFQAYVVQTARAGARLLYWGQAGSPGQISVDYGQPVWKAEYAAAIESDKLVGRRWRLGQDFWTTFDTNLPVRVADAELAPGAYYLTLEKRGDGSFVLAFNDPATIRERRTDPYLAHLTSGGTEAEMLHETSEEIADKLSITLETKADELNHGALTIRFGPHVLAVPIEVRFGG